MQINFKLWGLLLVLTHSLEEIIELSIVLDHKRRPVLVFGLPLSAPTAQHFFLGGIESAQLALPAIRSALSAIQAVQLFGRGNL